MTGPSIRPVVRDDLPAALSLINEEGWNYTIDELERMLVLDPHGSFMAEKAGPVGIVTSVSYSRTGVIGHLVVAKSERGKRIGQALLERVLDHLDGTGTDSILVYATKEGEPLYRKHGFQGFQDVHCLNVHLPVHIPQTAARGVKRAEERHFAGIMALDAELFGDDRRSLLEPLLVQYP